MPNQLDFEGMDEPTPQANTDERSTANRLTPRGVVVVDPAGWIRAANSNAMAWIHAATSAGAAGPWHLRELAIGVSFDEELRRVIAGEHVRDSVASIPNGPETCSETSIRWTLLSGELGPQVLLTFEPRSEDAGPQALDALTRLPDRRAISNRIARWRQTEPRPPRFAVLFVDLNGFKAVNDQLGHAAGDIVLQTLAGRLQNSIRDGDLACRYGGDEFVLLIHGAASPAEIEPVLARVNAAIEQQVHINGRSLMLTATIGWAAPGGMDWTAESLVAAADADMYARKRAMLR